MIVVIINTGSGVCCAPMPDTLKSEVSFVAVAPGGTATLPHHLAVSGRPLAPDHIELAPGFSWVTSNTVSITVMNNNAGAANCLALAEVWHPIERSFGLAPDDGTFDQHLPVRPYVVTSADPVPTPVSAPFQFFTYTVTGAEPDLTELVITLPTPFANTNYGVIVACNGVTNIAGFDVHTKTTTQFTVSTTGAMTAGDTLAIFAAAFT